MTVRLLKFTEFAENVLCIYRNLYHFDGIQHCLIIMRIITEVALTSAHCVIRTFHYRYHPMCINDVLYFYLTSTTSIVLIFLACYYSKTYKCLISNMNSGYSLFTTDKKYKKRLEGSHSVYVGFVFVVCVAKVLLFTYIQLSSDSSPNLPPFWHYLFQLNLLFCDFRYIFEYLVLYCVLHVMSEQLQCVTRSINKKNRADHNNEQLTAEVDEWSGIYKHIRESAKLFNCIFGVQLTVVLSTTMFYYIFFLYTVASQSVKGVFIFAESGLYAGTLVLMVMILYMLSQAAQNMENSADLLRRRLCKLLILSLSNTDCYKATRDLLRMMSTRPIRAHACGSISVDMTLLPTCVSFFTTYTVIALQFNNVV